jgi:hypothetical protein
MEQRVTTSNQEILSEIDKAIREKEEEEEEKNRAYANEMK